MSNRALGRDVHIYDANDPATVLGGLILTNGVTNANLYSMVEIIFIFERDYFLRDEGDAMVQRDNHPLQPGNYYIVTSGRFFRAYIVKPLLIAIGSITVSDEPWLVRTISLQSGTHVATFRNAVRERDRRCVITGRRARGADRGNWAGFEAAHIFPLAYEGHWRDHNYGRWITIPPATESAGSINSVQNGLLLRSDIRSLFDNYLLSINPDV